jgi:thymidine phosphorylase
MHPIKELILKKRDGLELGSGEIEELIAGVNNGPLLRWLSGFVE